MPDIFLLTKRIFIAILIVFCSFNASAQFNVITGSTATQYVNNLIGAGVSFSNATLSGDPTAIANFTGANLSLGFPGGVILTTGVASSANQLAFENASTSNGGLSDVPLLNGFVDCGFGAPTNNGLILEFDFVPQSSPVSFKYIFASEEYPEFVCSSFNDAFGFFISGPGITGQVNLAFIPGSNDPITINTVNNGTVGSAGDPFSGCTLGNSQYFNSSPPPDIVYDGYTLPLIATADVTPCQTYHIRLVIADGCDENFDSAVFLEAGSFGSSPVSVNSLTLNNDSTIYEGCAPATFVITKNDPALLNQQITVNFTIGGTATPTTDFTGITSSATVPAGQISTSLTISALVDGIAEGTETIEVIYSVSCGSFDTLILYIRNATPLVVGNGTPVSICNGQVPVSVSCPVSGGVPPYSYSWSNGGGTNAIGEVSPTGPTTYTLTVTDFCGNTASGTVSVGVGQIPAVPVIAPLSAICENEALNLIASTTTAGATISWSGPNGFTSTGPTVSITSASAANSGFYIVSASLGGCNSATTLINVVVNTHPTVPVIATNSPVCENAELTLTAVSSPATATINWTGPNGYTATGASVSIPLVTLAAGGIYAATADIAGCFAASAGSSLVVITDSPDPPIVNTTTPICAGLDLSLSTTSVAEFYAWTGPQGYTASTASETRTAITSAMAGDYSLVVRNGACSSLPTTVNVVVYDATFTPELVTNSPACEGSALNLSTPLIQNGTYFWSGPSGFASADQNPVVDPATISMSGIYSLYVVVGTCTTTTTTSDLSVLPQPTADAGLDIQLCGGDVGQIGSPGQPGFTYSWSPIEGLISPSSPSSAVNLSVPSGNVVVKNYILTVSSGACSDRDTVVAEITPTPVASFLPVQKQCFDNNSFDFSSNGVFTSAQPRFAWSFGPFASSDSSSDRNPQNIHFSSTGTQSVSLVIIDRGCVSLAFSQPVEVLPMPVSNFTASRFEGCEPLQVTFTNLSENQVSGDLFYSWSFGEEKESVLESPSVIFQERGSLDVSLTVTDAAGCSDKYTVAGMISVYPTPKAGFNIAPSTIVDITDARIFLSDVSVDASQCVYLIGSIDSVFQFDATYTFQDTGNYLIIQILSNEYGCVDSASNVVRVDLGYKVFIPSSFTPNADGLNDYFRIYGEDISTFEMVIYDRWGEQIYVSHDMENGWDGSTKLSNKGLPGGLYTYKIKLKDRYDRNFGFDGTVTVLK